MATAVANTPDVDVRGRVIQSYVEDVPLRDQLGRNCIRRERTGRVVRDELCLVKLPFPLVLRHGFLQLYKAGAVGVSEFLAVHLHNDLLYLRLPQDIFYVGHTHRVTLVGQNLVKGVAVDTTTWRENTKDTLL